MIALFPQNEVNFEHNERVLGGIYSAKVAEQGNGNFSLELECPVEYASEIHEGMIVTAPTPRGAQPFRVYASQKTLNLFRVKARHIFYDTANNFLADCRPTNDNGESACEFIMAGRLSQSPIVLSSDIPGIHTAYYIRKTELEALMGADNSFLSVWGGHLIRDGYTAHFRNEAIDRGFTVELGKNLTGVEALEDTTQVATKVMPTFVLEDNQVYTLPEVYITSPLADRYPMEIVRELRVELSEAQRKEPPEALHGYIREQVAEAFAEGLDKPALSYRVNFVLLSKTEAYKDLKLLEHLDIFDIVTCHIPTLGIDAKLQVSGYLFDAIKEVFISIDLGDTRPSAASLAKQVQRTIEQQITRDDSPMMIKVNAGQKKIAEQITGAAGGHIVIKRDAAGKPYELLIMDTDDIATAKDVIRLNKNGLALSTSGYNGPYGVAMDAEHGLYARYIHALKVTAAMIEAGAVTADKLSSTELYSINGSFTGDVVGTGWYIHKGGDFSLAGGHVVGDANKLDVYGKLYVDSSYYGNRYDVGKWLDKIEELGRRIDSQQRELNSLYNQQQSLLQQVRQTASEAHSTAYTANQAANQARQAAQTANSAISALSTRISNYFPDTNANGYPCGQIYAIYVVRVSSGTALEVRSSYGTYHVMLS